MRDERLRDVVIVIVFCAQKLEGGSSFSRNRLKPLNATTVRAHFVSFHLFVFITDEIKAFLGTGVN